MTRITKLKQFASILEDQTVFDVAGAKSIAIFDPALDFIRVIRAIRG